MSSMGWLPVSLPLPSHTLRGKFVSLPLPSHTLRGIAVLEYVDLLTPALALKSNKWGLTTAFGWEKRLILSFLMTVVHQKVACCWRTQ